MEMTELIPKSATASSPVRGLTLIQFIIFKFIVMTAFVIALAYLQGWASKNSYKAENHADFKVGLLHGFLMPAAFPGLLGGHDLPIYAPNNSGRTYKIGYILGINTCGTLFFGLAFWGMGGPRRKAK
jgi:hypothetical protein